MIEEVIFALKADDCRSVGFTVFRYLIDYPFKFPRTGNGFGHGIRYFFRHTIPIRQVIPVTMPVQIRTFAKSGEDDALNWSVEFGHIVFQLRYETIFIAPYDICLIAGVYDYSRVEVGLIIAGEWDRVAGYQSLTYGIR